MYLAFIDESGTLQKDDPQNHHYVLTAMVMQEQGMKFLHHRTQGLKNEIWQIIKGKNLIIPRNFELHMQDIIDAKKSFKSLRGQTENTERILRLIYKFISSLYIKVISIVIVKKNFCVKYQESEMIDWALRLVIERINRYIHSETQQNKDKEYSLLVMDADFSSDKNKRNFISKMMDEGVTYNTGDADRVLDTPIFLKSELHNGIQIVDSIAYLINRYTRKILEGKSSTLFDSLSNFFLFSLGSKFYGGIPSQNQYNGIYFFPSNPPINYWEVFDINNYY